MPKNTLETQINKRMEGVYSISLSGSLNNDTYNYFENRVIDVLNHNPDLLVIDMENLQFISSMGIRVIIKAKKKLKENNAELALINLTEQIKKVFEVINALPNQKVFGTVQELDNYLAKIQNKYE